MLFGIYFAIYMVQGAFMRLLLLLCLTTGAFSAEQLYKEYSLKSGQSIASLIYSIHNISKLHKVNLIKESLRVNKLTPTSAHQLPVGYNVLIPITVFDYHSNQKSNIQTDLVQTKNSAIARLNKNLDVKEVSTQKHIPLFIKVSLENTRIHTEKTLSTLNTKASDLQSLNIGLYGELTDSVMLGGSITKDISATESSFMNDNYSSTAGLSYNFARINSLNFDVSAFYQNKYYNFDGLDIPKFGKINQKSIFLGLRSSYQFNYRYSISGEFDYAVSRNTENTAANALAFVSTHNYQTELSFQYSFNDKTQFFLSLANETIEWEKESRVIGYNSDLFKLGVLFKL